MNRNCLSRKEVRQLENLIDEHKKRITSGEWTVETFTDMVARKLGRPVTPNNTRGAAQTMEVNFVTTQRGEKLKAMHQLQASITILADHIIRRDGEMGVVCPPNVRLLGSQITEDDIKVIYN